MGGKARKTTSLLSLTPSKAEIPLLPQQLIAPPENDDDEHGSCGDEVPSVAASDAVHQLLKQKAAQAAMQQEQAAQLEHLSWSPYFHPIQVHLKSSAAPKRALLILPMKVQSTYFDCKSNLLRRPPTLGDLIMMSRRRSYQRKAIQTRRQNVPMEFMKNAVQCCISGTNNGTRRLQRKWKRQIQLKLMSENEILLPYSSKYPAIICLSINHHFVDCHFSMLSHENGSDIVMVARYAQSNTLIVISHRAMSSYLKLHKFKSLQWQADPGVTLIFAMLKSLSHNSISPFSFIKISSRWVGAEIEANLANLLEAVKTFSFSE
ncbi:hypothetical protein TEA_001998 [Camellia sinensis var. sinensis]|uniref:Uncharacterized protein n=1 Tax=Camellia sinensis var. sinensis TaxID=542762 RepID=A0A4S4E155_CAMSN|nr:hypothetical protein TEA_001998 [Camellia sinensis var. sinensis]